MEMRNSFALPPPEESRRRLALKPSRRSADNKWRLRLGKSGCSRGKHEKLSPFALSRDPLEIQHFHWKTFSETNTKKSK